MLWLAFYHGLAGWSIYFTLIWGESFLQQLLYLDREILAFINNNLAQRTIDPLMKLWSAEWPWYLLLAYFLLTALFKKQWQTIRQFLWIGLTVGVSDIVAAHLLKPWILRLRPCRAEDWIRIVDGCNGKYGFPSNHAANAAVFATMWYALHNRTQGILAICCGLMVGLSRVYLGVHYPADIMAGYLFGFSVGVISLYLGKQMQEVWKRKLASPL